MVRYNIYFSGLFAYVRRPKEGAPTGKTIVSVPGMGQCQHQLKLMLPLNHFATPDDWRTDNTPKSIVEDPAGIQYAIWDLSGRDLRLEIEDRDGARRPARIKLAEDTGDVTDLNTIPFLGDYAGDGRIADDILSNPPKTEFVSSRFPLTLADADENGNGRLEAIRDVSLGLSSPAGRNTYATRARLFLDVEDAESVVLRANKFDNTDPKIFILKFRPQTVVPREGISVSIVNLPRPVEEKTMHHFKMFYDLSLSTRGIATNDRDFPKLPDEAKRGGGPIWCTPARLWQS